jgi:hypothetical protein
MNPEPQPQPTEAEVRAMRDKAYGRPCSNNNWAGCRDFWMQPHNIAWLKAVTSAPSTINHQPSTN